MSRIRADFYPNFSEAIFKEQGIDGCIAVQADSSEEETLFLFALAEQYDFIKGVVGWVDLQAKNIEDRLSYFAQFEHIKGFRHVIQGEKDPLFFQRPAFIHGIKALAAFDFAYDILIYPHQIEESIKFAAKLSDQVLVLDHMAKAPLKGKDIQQWKKDMQGFKFLEHVYAKISGIITEADWAHWTQDEVKQVVEVALEVFGPDRLMFGSDYPVVLVAGELEAWKKSFMQCMEALSPIEKKKITLDNCLHVYQTEL
jgi:L-fuconolactonase